MHFFDDKKECMSFPRFTLDAGSPKSGVSRDRFECVGEKIVAMGGDVLTGSDFSVANVDRNEGSTVTVC